jgi:hypothetical protein
MTPAMLPATATGKSAQEVQETYEAIALALKPAASGHNAFLVCLCGGKDDLSGHLPGCPKEGQ